MTPGVDDAGSSEVVQFVLDCLVKMPLIICEAIANQVCNLLVLLKITLLASTICCRLVNHSVGGSLSFFLCSHGVWSFSYTCHCSSVVVELPIVWPVRQQAVAGSCGVNVVLCAQLPVPWFCACSYHRERKYWDIVCILTNCNVL